MVGRVLQVTRQVCQEVGVAGTQQVGGTWHAISKASVAQHICSL